MEQIFDSEICARCKGRGYCGKPCRIWGKIQHLLPKTRLQFSGSSPPEIFVGRIGYPEVNTGILAPQEYGETEEMSMPELWHKKNLSIEQILNMRSQLIYSRFKSRILDARKKSRFLNIMQEISMSGKSVSAEFILKKAPRNSINVDKYIPLIGNPAPLKSIRLEENPHIEKKVDYLVSDSDAKSVTAITELHKSGIQTSNIIKILSAGLLGLRQSRKLVPTRWATTAVDSTISKELMKKIRYFPLIDGHLVFSGEYVGNHYEIILIPRFWSYEVIEAKISGSVWNPFSQNNLFMQDYEGFFDRKDYAEEVAGGYYSPRLAVAEYLTRVKKQASCLVLRESRPEYNAPLGVGILRETTRAAFKKSPRKFDTLNNALKDIQTRLTLPISSFVGKSKLIKELEQKTLGEYFKII